MIKFEDIDTKSKDEYKEEEMFCTIFYQISSEACSS